MLGVFNPIKLMFRLMFSDILLSDDPPQDDMKNKIPMKRFGERHELENLASYLMSDVSGLRKNL